MRKLLVAVVSALFFILVPVSAADAGSGTTTGPAAILAPESPACCASAWYPFGYYSTKAKCDAAGKKFVREIAIALAHKCTKYKGEWKLSILEAT